MGCAQQRTSRMRALPAGSGAAVDNLIERASSSSDGIFSFERTVPGMKRVAPLMRVCPSG